MAKQKALDDFLKAYTLPDEQTEILERAAEYLTSDDIAQQVQLQDAFAQASALLQRLKSAIQSSDTILLYFVFYFIIHSKKGTEEESAEARSGCRSSIRLQ